MRLMSRGLLFALTSTLSVSLSCGTAEPPRETAAARQASALEPEQESIGWVAKDSGLPEARNGIALAYDAARGNVLLFGGYGTDKLADTWLWNGTRWDVVTPVPGSEVPPVREAHALAYDSARERVVLFGGWGDSGQLGDTWEWDGVKWTNVTPTESSDSPSRRYGHALAYDAARGKVLLFGGNATTGRLADTWEWDGAKWTQLSPTESPPSRYAHALAYDGTREKVVLFGGTSGGLRDDVWEWDGTNWTEILPDDRPSPRAGHTLAYDAVRGKVMLVGGNSTEATQIVDLNDVWEWDGVNWNEVTPASPAESPLGRQEHGLAFDTARGKVVLFGGVGADQMNDTWEWDGTGWTEVKRELPAGRHGHGLAYDAKHGKTVLFGGSAYENLADTWEWDGTTWAEITFTDPNSIPSPRFAPALAYDAAREKVVLFGGSDWATRLNDTWSWDGATKLWQQVTPSDPNESPPPRHNPAIAYDAARERVVLFGGDGDAGFLADTWVWDGVRWENVTPSDPLESPPARSNHALAYDADRERVVLFGGLNESWVLDDTWEWDGTKWTDVTPDTGSPAGRETPSLVYRGEGKVLLFGGNDYSSYLGDAWEWDGTSWTPVISTASPSGRYAASAAFDSARQKVVLFGGYDNRFLDDTWEFGALSGCAIDADCETGVCVGGTCQDLCANVTCAPPDPCHEAACDPHTGSCSHTPIADSGTCGDEPDGGDEIDAGGDTDVDAGGDAGGDTGNDAGENDAGGDEVCRDVEDGTWCAEDGECIVGLCRSGVCERTHRLDGTRCEGGICIAGACMLDREPTEPGGAAGADTDDGGVGSATGPSGAGAAASDEGEEGGGSCSVSARSTTPGSMVTSLAFLTAMGLLRRARRADRRR